MLLKIPSSKCIMLDALSILSDNPPKDVAYDKARSILGYNPKIEVEEGVERFLKFLIEQGEA